MWFKRLAIWCGAVGFTAALGLAGGANASPVKGDSVSIPSLTLFDGQHRPAGYYTGKPVVIQYWASWCPFCARQNPYLQRLWDNAQGTDLEVLAISIDDDEADARQYIEDRNYTFPTVMQTPELLEEFGKRRVIPEIIVLTADGTIAEIIPGEMFEEDVLNLIQYATTAK